MSVVPKRITATTALTDAQQQDNSTHNWNASTLGETGEQTQPHHGMGEFSNLIGQKSRIMFA